MVHELNLLGTLLGRYLECGDRWLVRNVPSIVEAASV